jgi:hypothetical protein
MTGGLGGMAHLPQSCFDKAGWISKLIVMNGARSDAGGYGIGTVWWASARCVHAKQ